jgi:hypothetical protein
MKPPGERSEADRFTYLTCRTGSTFNGRDHRATSTEPGMRD